MSKEFVHAILLNFQTQYNDCSEIFNALKISGYVQGVEIYKSSRYSLSSHEKSSDWINVLPMPLQLAPALPLPMHLPLPMEMDPVFMTFFRSATAAFIGRTSGP